MSQRKPFDPKQTYSCLDNQGRMITIDAGDFWKAVSSGSPPEMAKGYLVSAYHFAAHWPHWERHPAGEEYVFLTSGEMELIVDEGDQETTVKLRQGQAFVIPKGKWHRALVHSPCEMFAITPGEGTEHRQITAP